jgi:NAD(P)-dependent dehydrogenase (short-subunit alcohol dehydrogenase family)
MIEHEPITISENREKPLAGKVALITGSSRDIGAEIAKALGQEGVNIIGNYKEKEKRAVGTQQEWTSLGIKFEFVQADITLEEDRKKLEDAVKKSFGGKLDYLILNAPVFSKNPTDDKSPNEHLTDELLPLMSKGGAILFMQSVPGHYEPQLKKELINNESIKDYSPAAEKKYKDEQSLRKRTEEFKKQGVLLVVVCPPIIEDTTNVQLYFGRKNAKFVEESKKVSKKLGLPESMTKAEVGKKIAELLKRKDIPMGYTEFFKEAK